MATLSDMMTVRKWIYGNGNDDRQYYLNPFCSMLFCESVDYPECFSQHTAPTRFGNPEKKSSIKADIIAWFTSLDHDQKCSVTAFKNSKFLHSFINNYKNWDPNKIYHIYQNRKILNCYPKLKENTHMETVMNSACIAWLQDPIIYFKVEAEESSIFFNTLLKWLDIVSDKKIFQFANKIKNKNDPEENYLWFTDKTFQPLHAWFVNEIEKNIIRNYYNKNNFQLDDFSKIKKLRMGALKNFTKKQTQNMFSMSMEDTKINSLKELQLLQEKVKIYQDQYYEEVALLMDYEAQNLNIDEKGKKKKKKKKKKNKKNVNFDDGQQKSKEKERESLSNEYYNDQSRLEESIPLLSHQENCQKQQEFQKLSNQLQQKTDSNQTQLQQNANEETEKSMQTIKEKEQVKNQKDNIKEDEQLNKKEQENIECQHKEQQYDVEQQLYSGQSISWSNIETYTKSGQSHPQFSQVSPQEQINRNPRSLSPEPTPLNQAGKRKRKNTNSQAGRITKRKTQFNMQHENKTTITMNKDEQFMEQEESQANMAENKGKQKEFSEEGNQQEIRGRHKKRRRRNNKGGSLLKELMGKISNSFIDKQLNSFVDNISIQSNRITEHKMVAYRRICAYLQLFIPTCEATLFGSNAVGLSLPTSDIDIMLSNLPCICKEEAKQILANLAIQINSMAWIVSCSAYLNAKVPLVKLEIDPRIGFLQTKRKSDYFISPFEPQYMNTLELKSKKDMYSYYNSCQNRKNYNIPPQSHLNTDSSHKHESSSNQIIKADLTISLNNQSNFGAQSTELMRKWLCRYPQMNWVIIAFKYILTHRGFSSNFKGGIGSYCLFILIAAYMREFSDLDNLGEGEIFMGALKFYGQEFQNQIKSIRLVHFDEDESSHSQQHQKQLHNFISLQQTYQILKNSNEDSQLLYNIQTNPLRIIDPINNRIMSGSCYLYPQIKGQFRRIYKELSEAKINICKEVELTVNGSEIPKMLENKKTIDKWINKYEGRSGFSIKNILEGGI